MKTNQKVGTRTSNVGEWDERYDTENESIILKALKIRDVFEEQGETDRCKKLQPPRPNVDENIVGLEI